MADSLYKFQETGVDFLAANKTAMLADEPGLGKTVQAIRACDKVTAHDILVVCPAIAKQHWAREFKRWQTVNRLINVVEGFNGTIEANQVNIVNYDLLSNKKSGVLKQCLKWLPKTVILDEGHYLKSHASNRTKAIYGTKMMNGNGITRSTTRVWVLTGTPSPNHAGEIWTHLSALAPDLIGGMDRFRYEDRYCKIKNTIFGRQITGSRNMKELRRKIEPFVLRRKVKDVLPDMPGLTIDWVPLDPNLLSPADQKAFKANTWLPPGFVGKTGDDLLQALRSQGTHLATERRVTGMLKVGLCMDWLLNEMQGGGKFIVFAHHHAVIDAIMERAKAADILAVRVDGRVSGNVRQAAVDVFQDTIGPRLFVGQTAAAGEVITLTAARRVVFFEADWTPAKVYQAIRRAYRIGQTQPVLAQLLTLKGSLDEEITKALVRKARDIHELFG